MGKLPSPMNPVDMDKGGPDRDEAAIYVRISLLPTIREYGDFFCGVARCLW